MEPDSELYEDVVRVYIQVIRHDSPQAAAIVESIQSLSGWRAALRATHILTLLKLEIKQHRYFPDLTMYAHIFNAYPEALSLLEEAIHHCLKAWDIPNVDVSLKDGNTPHHRM